MFHEIKIEQILYHESTWLLLLQYTWNLYYYFCCSYYTRNLCVGFLHKMKETTTSPLINIVFLTSVFHKNGQRNAFERGVCLLPHKSARDKTLPVLETLQCQSVFHPNSITHPWFCSSLSFALTVYHRRLLNLYMYTSYFLFYSLII